MVQPPPKFIDFVSQALNTDEWPLPEVNNTIPKFNYEVVKVNKQVSQLLVRQLKHTSNEVALHPKYDSVIVAEKYYVVVDVELGDVAKLWDDLLEEVTLSQVYQFVSVPLFDKQPMPHRSFGFLEEPVLEYLIDKEGKNEQVKLKPVLPAALVPVPIILQPRHVSEEVSLPHWEYNDRVTLFDVFEEELDSKLPELQYSPAALLPKQHNLVSKYSVGLDVPSIAPTKQDHLSELSFETWKSPELTHSYDTHDLNMFLFEREITHSRKYMVQPTATSYKQGGKSAESILESYINTHFAAKSWHLNKYQLIVEMEWKPITANINTLQSHFLVEQIESKMDAKSVPLTINDIKLDPCVTEDIILDYPQLQEQTTTQIEVDNGATNFATYHDDTDALVKLVASKKRKLDTKVIDIPQELALLLFLHPKTKQEKDVVEAKEEAEDTSKESRAPQYSIFFDSSFSESTKEYQFPSNQYIALSQSFWNKDYPTAKSLSEKLHVVEAKFTHSVDIVINTTSAIYTTPADLLIQSDGKSTEFLIMQEILTIKQHFHKLYIVAIVNSPSFVTCAGFKLKKLQLICLALNIKLLFVSKEDVLLWCLEIIDLESPQLIEESFDLEDQLRVLLCECGLTYFQAMEVLKVTSLEEFIKSSVDDKLKKFKELVTPELLVRI